MTLSSRNVKKIFELKDADHSIRAISAELKIGITTVHRYLKKGEEIALSRKSRSRGKEKIIGRSVQKKREIDEEILTGSQMLDLIISEVTQSIERPAIVRMVEGYLGGSDGGMGKLSEALDLANIGANNKQFILRNWSNYAGVANIDKYLGVEKKKSSKEAIQNFFEQQQNDEIKRLKELQKRKELADLKKQVEKSEEAQDKVPLVVDGIMMYVAPQERSDWWQYETEQKQREREREERRDRYNYRGEERKESDERIEEIDRECIQNENEKNRIQQKIN